MSLIFARVNAPLNADVAYKVTNANGDESFVAGLIRQSFTDGNPTQWGAAEKLDEISIFSHSSRKDAAFSVFTM